MRLAQVISNLLHNAAKYTEPGGHIALQAWREAGCAMLAVQDNGIGIPAPLLPHVFDPFTQAEHNYERAQGGLGVGLTLVRRMVDMHAGTVEAHSAGPGQGSRFVVTLPLRTAPPATRQAMSGQAMPGSAPAPATAPLGRILIVDDNVDAADSLAALLRLLGAQVDIVYDGPAALTAHRAHGHDVVLLDLGLPGMNGLEVARRLRRPPHASQALLIALTGWGQEQDMQRSLAAGIDHHLVKPVNLSVLEALLAQQPQQRRPAPP